jgi:hypothetical protein
MTTSPQPPNPSVNDTRINADGDLEYFSEDGQWVRYEDPLTPLLGKDPEPNWVEKMYQEAADDEGAADDRESE